MKKSASAGVNAPGCAARAEPLLCRCPVLDVVPPGAMGTRVGGKCSTHRSSSGTPPCLAGVLCKGRGGGKGVQGAVLAAAFPSSHCNPASSEEATGDRLHGPKPESTPVPAASAATGPPRPPLQALQPQRSPRPRSRLGS